MKKNLFKIFGVVVLTGCMLGLGLYCTYPPGEVRAQSPTSNAVQFTVVAVADTNTTITWAPMVTRELSIYNSGSSTAFIDFTGGTAAITDMPIYADMTMNFSPFTNAAISLICASGESTTVTLYAPKYTAP